MLAPSLDSRGQAILVQEPRCGVRVRVRVQEAGGEAPVRGAGWSYITLIDGLIVILNLLLERRAI